MTEIEKRRSELLAQTRAQYRDKYVPPAIHPRWKNTYDSLYQGENAERTKSENSSFWGRTVIAFVLFCLFAMADYRGMEETKTIANEIVRDYAGFVDFNFFD